MRYTAEATVVTPGKIVDKEEIKKSDVKVKINKLLPSKAVNRSIVKKSPQATIKVAVAKYNLLTKMEKDKQRFFKESKEFLYD